MATNRITTVFDVNDKDYRNSLVTIKQQIELVENRFKEATKELKEFDSKLQSMKDNRKGILTGAIASDIASIKKLQAELRSLQQQKAESTSPIARRKLTLDINDASSRLLSKYNQEVTKLTTKTNSARAAISSFNQTIKNGKTALQENADASKKLGKEKATSFRNSLNEMFEAEKRFRQEQKKGYFSDLALSRKKQVQYRQDAEKSKQLAKQRMSDQKEFNRNFREGIQKAIALNKKKITSDQKVASSAKTAFTKAMNAQKTAYAQQRSSVLFALKQQKRQELANRTLGASFTRLRTKILGTATANRALGVSHTNVGNAVIRHIRRIESLAVAYYGLTRAYTATLGAGITFNREMENAQITIASIIASTSENIAVDSGGEKRAVQEAEKWKIALAEANRYKKQIVQLNPETPLDLKDTTKIFQILLPQMRQYNATNKQKLELTKLLSIATRTGNLTMMEMKSGLDGLVGGTTRSNSELMIYLGTLGITKEKLSALAKEGKSIDFLLEKMKGLSAAGELLKNTLDGRFTALRNEWDTMMGSGTESLFQGFKDEIKNLTDYFKTNREEWIINIRTFVGDIKAMGSSIGEFYQTLKTSFIGLMDFTGIKSDVTDLRDGFVWLTDAIRENKTVIAQTALAYGVFKVGGLILGGVTGLIGLVGKLTGATWLLNTAMLTTGASSKFLMVGGWLATGITFMGTKLFGVGTAASTAAGGIGILSNSFSFLPDFARNAINKVIQYLGTLSDKIANVASKLNKLGKLKGMVGAALLLAPTEFGKDADLKVGGRIEELSKLLKETGDKYKNVGLDVFGVKDKYIKQMSEYGAEIDKLSKLQTTLKKTTGEVSDEFQKVFNTDNPLMTDVPKGGALTGIGSDRLSYETAKRKAEIEALKQEQTAFDTLLAKKVEAEEDKTATAKAIREAAAAAKKYATWQDRLDTNYQKILGDKLDGEANLAKKRYENDMKFAKTAQDRHRIETIYQNTLADIEQKRYDTKIKGENKAQKAIESASKKAHNEAMGKLREMKAYYDAIGDTEKSREIEDKLRNARYKFLSGDQKNAVQVAIDAKRSKADAKKIGNSISEGFKKGITGAKGEKASKSFGAKLAESFGNAIQGSLTDFINGNGDVTLREASRDQFDSQIGGAIRSEYPMAGLAADIYSALNTETKNEFQRMDVNIDSDNTGIADSITLLKNVMTPELSYTRKMLSQLEDMNAKFGSITAALTALSLDFNGINYNKEDLSSGDIFTDGVLTSYESGGVKGGIGGLIGGFMDSLFGSTTKELIAKGIGFGEQSAESFMDGVVNGYSYTTEKVTKKKFFGFSKKVGFKTVKTDMDVALEAQFSQAMNEGYSIIADAMVRVGATEQDISGVVFKEKVIDAQDMNEEEYQKALTGLMTARLDTLTKGMWSDIEDYRIAGEKTFETGIRVATGIDQATYALDRLGIESVKYDEVLNKTATNFGGEVARTSILYEEGMKNITETMTTSFFGLMFSFDKEVLDKSALTGIGKYIETLSGTTEEVIKAYTAVKDFQFGMQFFNDNFTEFNLLMIDGAGSLNNLISGQASYFENFYTAQERSTINFAKMNEQMNFLGVSMPTSNEGFRSLVESVDLSTDAGNKLYGSLLSLSSGFNDVMVAEEALTNERLAGIEKLRDTLLSMSGISTLFKREYTKALYTSALRTNDEDNAIKYGSSLMKYNTQTQRGSQAYLEQEAIFNSLNARYGDNIKVQEVKNPDADKKMEAMIEAIDLLRAEVESQTNAINDGKGINGENITALTTETIDELARAVA